MMILFAGCIKAPAGGSLADYRGEYILAGVTLSALSSSNEDWAVRQRRAKTLSLTEEDVNNWVREAYEPPKLFSAADPLGGYGVDTQYVFEGASTIIYTSPLYPDALWLARYADNTADGSRVIADGIELYVRSEKNIHWTREDESNHFYSPKDADYRFLRDDENLDPVLEYEGESYPLGTGFGGYGLVDSIVMDGKLYYTYSWGSGLHRSLLAAFDLKTRTIQHFSVSYETDMMIIDTPIGAKVYLCTVEPSDNWGSFHLAATELVGSIFEHGAEPLDAQPIVTGDYFTVSSSSGMSVKVNQELVKRYPDCLCSWYCEGGRLCIWDEKTNAPVELERDTAITEELIWIPDGAEGASISLRLFDPKSAILSSDSELFSRIDIMLEDGRYSSLQTWTDIF